VPKIPSEPRLIARSATCGGAYLASFYGEEQRYQDPSTEDFGLGDHLVHRRLDGCKPLVYLSTHIRMREHVKFVVPDGVEDTLGDGSRV
jgi:hypothetical protein